MDKWEELYRDENKIQAIQNFLTSHRTIQIFLIFIFFGIVLIQIIIFFTPSTNGFILDIFGYYPAYYWGLLLFLIFFCGILLTYYSLYNSDNKFIILIAFALFILTCTVFEQANTLFFFNGKGDPLEHLGYINDILQYGNYYTNKYPLTHTLIAIVSAVSNISIITLTKHIQTIFFLLYFISMYIIGRILLKNSPLIYYFLGLAALPIFGALQTHFWPNMSMIFITPFFIYLLIKCNTKSYQTFLILIIAMILVISVGHLLYFLLWIILLIAIYFILLFLKKQKNYEGESFLLIPIIISIILFYYINFQNAAIQDFVLYPIEILLKSGGEPLMEGEVISQVSRIQPDTSILKLIKVIIFNYGTFIIFALISGVTFLFLMIKSFFYHKKFNNYFILTIFCSVVLYVITVLNFFISSFKIYRIFNVANIFVIISIPIALICLKKNYPNRKSTLLVIMATFFILLSIISVFSIQPSYTYTYHESEQVSEADYIAMTTFFNYWEDYPVIETIAESVRLHQAIYGVVASKNFLYYINEPGKHFGYNYFNTFAQGHGSGKYFIDIRIRYLFENYPASPELGGYTKEDLFHLENDNTVNSIYSNSHTYIYLIN
nr:hypothetical protein [uncultured Methanoregula sp.]